MGAPPTPGQRGGAARRRRRPRARVAASRSSGWTTRGTTSTRAGEWLLALAGRARPDVVHLNGYAHAALPWARPIVVVAHSCVLSWHEAVRGRAAGAGVGRATARRVRARARGRATLLVAPTRGDARRARRALRPRVSARSSSRTAAAERCPRRAQGAARPRAPGGCGTRRRTSRRSTRVAAAARRGRSTSPAPATAGASARTRAARRARRRDDRTARWRPRGDLRRARALRAVRALRARGGAAPAARSCSATSRACARSGATRRSSSPPDDDGRARRGARAGSIADPALRGARTRAARASRSLRYTAERMADGLPRRLRPRRRPRSGGGRVRIVIFCHSLVSDWNHGNAHFLRGVVARAARARARGARSTSRATAGAGTNLVAEHGARAARRSSARAFPELASSRLRPRRGSTSTRALDGADLVLVHEWNDPRARAPRSAGAARHGGRSACSSTTRTTARSTAPGGDGRATTCAHYDGVLAFGDVIRGSTSSAAGRRAPGPGTRPPTRASSARCRAAPRAGDLVWIGNWGDDERTRRAARVPARARCARSGLHGAVHGVRYPRDARARARARRGHRATRGWLPNHRVPRGRSRATRVTVHVPRRPYVAGAARHPDDPPVRGAGLRHPARLARPGTTPRACSRPATTTSSRATAREMTRARCATSCATPSSPRRLARHGLRDDPRRATPARHRVDELLAIARELGVDRTPATADDGAAVVNIAFFGSSLVSAYWNGAATYYRGIIRALARARPPTSRSTSRTPTTARSTATSPTRRGPTVVVYRPTEDGGRSRALERGARRRPRRQGERRRRLRRAARGGACSTRGAPADGASGTSTRRRRSTRIEGDPRRPAPRAASRATTSSSPTAAATRSSARYRALGARDCMPIYNALDPATHHPVPPDPRFARRPRVPRQPAAGPRGARRGVLPARRPRCCRTGAFLLGGSGWEDKPLPPNVALHRPRLHRRPQRASTARRCAVLNVPARAWPRNGFSPATRVFEAAGAGACLITDAWEGIEEFLEPGREVLVARDGEEVAEHLAGLTAGAGAARSAPRRGARVLRRAHLRAARAAQVGADPGRHAVRGMRIVILGLSITSSWGNGHATTYRALVRALAARGHDVLFLERDVPWYAAQPRPARRRRTAGRELYALARRAARRGSRDDVARRRPRHRRLVRARGRRRSASGCSRPRGGVDRVLRHRHAGDAREARRRRRASTSRRRSSRASTSTSRSPAARRSSGSRTSSARRARVPLYCSVDPDVYRPLDRSRARGPRLPRHLQRRPPAGARAAAARAGAAAARARASSSPGRSTRQTLAWPANVERIEHLPPAEHAALLRRAALHAQRHARRHGRGRLVAERAAVRGRGVRRADRSPTVGGARRVLRARARRSSSRDRPTTSSTSLDARLAEARAARSAPPPAHACSREHTAGAARAASSRRTSRDSRRWRVTLQSHGAERTPGDAVARRDRRARALVPQPAPARRARDGARPPARRLPGVQVARSSRRTLPADLQRLARARHRLQRRLLHLRAGAARRRGARRSTSTSTTCAQARWAADAARPRGPGRASSGSRSTTSPAGRSAFDLVLFMGVLYHLRYPLLALDLLAEQDRRLLVLQTLTMPGDERALGTPPRPAVSTSASELLEPGWPTMAFIEHRFAGDPTNWWAPNHACVEAMLRSSGARGRRPAGLRDLGLPSARGCRSRCRDELDAALGRGYGAAAATTSRSGRRAC